VTRYHPEGKAVLVVEYNEDEREAMAKVLCREGYHVFTAVDSAHALAILRFGAKIDVIVAAILLPGMDGLTLLREREHFPKIAAIPVIMVTGLQIATAEWARSIGAADF
jgi:CheY-like chemotaxis protein